MNSWLRAAVVFGILPFFLVGCFDDDDDGPSDDAGKDIDLMAVVVEAFDRVPKDLPPGVTFAGVDFEYSWTTDAVATLEYWFNGTGGRQHHVSAVIMRTVAQAKDETEYTVDYLGAEEAGKNSGRYCGLEFAPIYLDVDLASTCVLQVESIYLDVETGPVGEDDAEDGVEILAVMEDYFKDILKDATDRPRKVDPRVLAAVLASVPANGPDGNAMDFPDDSVEDAPKGLVRSVSWSADETVDAYFYVFDTSDNALDYLRSDLGDDKAKAGDKVCVRYSSTTRDCGLLVGETVVIAERRSVSESAPAKDSELADWLDVLERHVERIRGGRVPPAPKATPTPFGAKTPTRVPTRAATDSPPKSVVTKGPAITRFNAGTWTFDLLITSNSCGANPAVGSSVQIQYEFTDSNGDGYIYAGERFSIRQTIPGVADAGAIDAELPSLSYVVPVTSGTRSGFAEVDLTFTSVNEAEIYYSEAYDDCELTGK
ncbi:MAG: hypothetical protein AB7N24_12940 [Dehalococcoidia bacterium]